MRQNLAGRQAEAPPPPPPPLRMTNVTARALLKAMAQNAKAAVKMLKA
jgi:hypothetical protein